MIVGQVNASLEPYVRLVVRGLAPPELDVDARIDTACNGALTLPPPVVAALNLPYVTTLQAALADGSSVAIAVFAATVLWDGTPRDIEVECTPGHCLVGT